MPILLGKRDSKAENHWIDVPPVHFAMASRLDMHSHKTVLCLPGSEADNPKAANGMCKKIEDMLSDEAKQVLGENIYSAYYHDNGNDIEEEAKAFFTEYLLPFVAKPEAIIKLKVGKKLGPEDALSVEQAKKNMRNLIIFTHCHGSEVIAGIESCFRTTLKDLGYSENDRNQIMKQMFVLHANDIQGNFGLTKATVIHRISQNDVKATGGQVIDSDFSESSKEFIPIRKLSEKNPVAWFSPTDNEGVLLFRSILDPSKKRYLKLEDTEMKVELDDHDGAFFGKNGLTPGASKGYELSGKVLDYVITSKGDMPDVNKIIAEAARNDNTLKTFVNDISKAGTDYFEGINAEIEQFKKLQENVINRIKKGELKEIPKELFSFSKEKLNTFFNDKRGGRHSVVKKLQTPSHEPSVLDYLFQKGDPKQVDVVVKAFPQFAETLAERALDENKKSLLPVLAPHCNDSSDNLKFIMPLIKDDLNNLPVLLPIIKEMNFGYNDENNLATILIASNGIQDEQVRTKVQRDLADILFSKGCGSYSVYNKLKCENPDMASALKKRFVKSLSEKTLNEFIKPTSTAGLIWNRGRYGELLDAELLDNKAKIAVLGFFQKFIEKDLEEFADRATKGEPVDKKVYSFFQESLGSAGSEFIQAVEDRDKEAIDKGKLNVREEMFKVMPSLRKTSGNATTLLQKSAKGSAHS